MQRCRRLTTSYVRVSEFSRPNYRWTTKAASFCDWWICRSFSERLWGDYLIWYRRTEGDQRNGRDTSLLNYPSKFEYFEFAEKYSALSCAPVDMESRELVSSTGTSESKDLRLVGLLKVLVRWKCATYDIPSDAISFDSVDINEESKIDFRSWRVMRFVGWGLGISLSQGS